MVNGIDDTLVKVWVHTDRPSNQRYTCERWQRPDGTQYVTRQPNPAVVGDAIEVVFDQREGGYLPEPLQVDEVR